MSDRAVARQRLDARNGRQAIMIGLYKVAGSPYADRWIGEIHAVVGGSDKVRLRQSFLLPLGQGDNYLHVEAVHDLATTLVEVLRPGVRVWQPPYAVEPIKVPGKKQRAEYYRWLLRLESDER
jgi:hypothetical protein